VRGVTQCTYSMSACGEALTLPFDAKTTAWPTIQAGTFSVEEARDQKTEATRPWRYRAFDRHLTDTWAYS